MANLKATVSLSRYHERNVTCPKCRAALAQARGEAE